jgi:hypothetical protein
MPELSVWEYLRSRLCWRLSQSKKGSPPEVALLEPGEPEVIEPPASIMQPKMVSTPPWSALLGLSLAFLAQRDLEVAILTNRSPVSGLILYAMSFALITRAVWRGELLIALPPGTNNLPVDNLTVRAIPLVLGFSLGLLTFIAAGNNRFTALNIGLLIASIACLVYTFWLPGPNRLVGINNDDFSPGKQRMRRKHLTIWLAIIVVLGIAAFFRFDRLAEIPGEMNSDHAEKILDILRLLNGQTNIFFPNNGGREALQLYLVAGLQRFFGFPVSFISLKIISSLAGFLAMPFIFLLGRELANNRTGLLAMAFFGVAYWPNVVSRLGLRLPFYILFTAIILFFLVRGLRRESRNDFIWLGLILGLSFYGYTADRILPMLVLLGIFIYFLHNRNQPGTDTQRHKVIWYTAMALTLAFIISLPMLRYAIDQPEAFLYRTLTRVSDREQSLAAPAALVFLRNTGNALAMFSWSNGETWTTSIPDRPALDIATGALFWSGCIAVLVTYVLKKRWQHLFLLLSIPVLMLPSILALAFPNENPNLYRTGGAVMPVFILLGLGLDGLMSAIQRWLVKSGKALSWSIAAILFLLSAYQSYDLVFNQYRQQYALNSWNSSEMGQVVRNFVGNLGSVDNAWVIGFPHWVDTRLVGMIADYPLHNFAMFTENLNQIPTDNQAKLFMINPQDQFAISVLKQRFPQGVLTEYPAKIPGKEFLIYFVPQQAEE